MTNEKLELLKQIEKDIYVCSLESTFLEDAKSCAIHEAIEELKKQRWIPVSERLPETDGVYTVTRRLFDNQIDTEPYYMVDACYFDGSNAWHNDNRINHSRHLLEDIIAWCELPELYKESEE